MLKRTILYFLIFILISGMIFFIKGNFITAEVVAKTNEDRISFLESHGLEVIKTPCKTEEIIIPTIFNETYERYNAVQREQNFNLKKYKGKKVQKICYIITNYGDDFSDIRANLLIYNKKIIGCDISSLSAPQFFDKLD